MDEMGCCSAIYYADPALRARYCAAGEPPCSSPPSGPPSSGDVLPPWYVDLGNGIWGHKSWLDVAYQSAVGMVGPILTPPVPTIDPGPDPNPPNVPTSDGSGEGTGSIRSASRCACDDSPDTRSHRSLWWIIAAGLVLWML